jgi:hypothetical protein
VKKLFVFVLSALLITSVITMSADARVLVKDKSVVKIGEDINVGQGLMFKDLVTIKGNANIKGDVGGDVVSVLGNVHLYPTAKVAGDVVSIGGTVTKDTGAVVKGQVTVLAMGGVASKGGNSMAVQCPDAAMLAVMAGTLFFKLLMFLGLLGLSVMIVSFMTKQIGVMSSKIENQMLNSLLWGIIGILLIMPVAFLLVVTVIGIPLIVVEVLFLSIAMLLGNIAVAQLIGKKFVKALKKPGQPMLVEVMYGLLLLFLVSLVPFLGGLVQAVTCTLGFGSALITKCGYKG